MKNSFETKAELSHCELCPRNCKVNRYIETGFCGAGHELCVNLAMLHNGEEPPISGSRGSGTIFFSHCNLKCVFCQNHQISCLGWGDRVSTQQLSNIMLDLQSQGAHNINLVTPTHYSSQIAESIIIAKSAGLYIPIVWNSNAYEHPKVLRKLEGLVDIFLPDMKYAHKIYAAKYSHAADYPDVANAAIREMYAMTGTLQCDNEGIAKSGFIIRLLVLPNGLAGIRDSLYRIASEIGTEVQLSIMAQYYPTHQASKYPELARGINASEYDKVIETVSDLGFGNVFMQELSCSSEWTPTFRKPIMEVTENAL